jgi:hypothetical protein
MRRNVMWLAVFAVGSCAIDPQVAIQQDEKKAAQCIAKVMATPDALIVFRRVWRGDGTDTANKLTDPKPLTPPEREALLRIRGPIDVCRQIIISSTKKYAAWQTPYWEELFQRGRQISLKLASGEIPVGLANKLYIESQGQYQVDASKAHADAVQADQIRQQQAAQAMLQASAQKQAAQPRVTTTNCMWIANTLNCTAIY